MECIPRDATDSQYQKAENRIPTPLSAKDERQLPKLSAKIQAAKAAAQERTRRLQTLLRPNRSALTQGTCAPTSHQSKHKEIDNPPPLQVMTTSRVNNTTEESSNSQTAFRMDDIEYNAHEMEQQLFQVGFTRTVFTGNKYCSRKQC